MPITVHFLFTTKEHFLDLRPWKTLFIKDLTFHCTSYSIDSPGKKIKK